MDLAQALGVLFLLALFCFAAHGGYYSARLLCCQVLIGNVVAMNYGNGT